MTNELQTVGAMHQCRAGEPYSTCVHCGALAEALNKPCPHFMRDAAQKLAAQPSPTPQADSQPAPGRDERSAFEVQFPVPSGVHWSGAEYVVKDSYINSYRCDRFIGQWEAWQARAARAPADSVTAPAGGVVGLDWMMRDELRSMIEGMSVSVDVSTGDHDAGHRYFGTVTEVMDCRDDKHGVTLLVQDAEPNFAPTPPAQAADSVLEDAARWQYLRDERDVALCVMFFGNGCINITIADVIKAIDAKIAARKQGANHA